MTIDAVYSEFLRLGQSSLTLNKLSFKRRHFKIILPANKHFNYTTVVPQTHVVSARHKKSIFILPDIVYYNHQK